MVRELVIEKRQQRNMRERVCERKLSNQPIIADQKESRKANAQRSRERERERTESRE